jgi:histidine triad (HIT) family protein
MPLTDEQAKTIKEQILSQIKNFPEDKREQIKSYIEGMNNEELEEFLIKNKMIKQEGESVENKSNINENRCVMCLIAEKQIESLPIYEDKNYLAVLEINPISKGHTILIPKKHIKESKSLPSKSFTIANKIGRHLVKKLKSQGAENFQVNSSDELNHAIINIIPKYKNQKLSFERKQAKKQELQDLAMTIGKLEKKQKPIKIQTEKSENSDKPQLKIKELSKSDILKFSRRIP